MKRLRPDLSLKTLPFRRMSVATWIGLVSTIVMLAIIAMNLASGR